MSVEHLKPWDDDRADSVLYMKQRRTINEEYAEHPVNFNACGLMAGQLALGRCYTPGDMIVDIGSNSGEAIAKAAEKTGAEAQIVCAEPDYESISLHNLLPIQLRRRIKFAQAYGEHLPFEDSSVQGATLHNVIFRAKDARAVLTEAKRVVMPGGFIAISSNARGHAFYRHLFERQVAEKVIALTGVNFALPHPPAEGQYLEDLPSLIEEVGGLEDLKELYVPQETRAIITPGRRLEDYLDVIQYSVADVDLPAVYREVWRKVVMSHVKSQIDAILKLANQADKTDSNQAAIPYFADTISRGMFVLLNKKS